MKFVDVSLFLTSTAGILLQMDPMMMVSAEFRQFRNKQYPEKCITSNGINQRVMISACGTDRTRNLWNFKTNGQIEETIENRVCVTVVHPRTLDGSDVSHFYPDLRYDCGQYYSNQMYEWTYNGYLKSKWRNWCVYAHEGTSLRMKECNADIGHPNSIWLDENKNLPPRTPPPVPATPWPTRAPTPAPTHDKAVAAKNNCMSETRNILDAADVAYDDEGMKKVPSNVGGKASIFYDFSSNAGNNAVYKELCQKTKEAGGHEGQYVTLDYSAICTYTDDTAEREQKTVKVYVKGHPRCYSSGCDAVSDQDELKEELFDSYTMHLTQLRNPGWFCSGNLGFDDKSKVPESSCELETELLSDLSDIIRDREAIKTPTLKEKKQWFVIPLQEQDVTFGASPVFSETCLKQNGLNKEIKDTKIMCSVEGDVANGKPFEIKGFSICIGETCASDPLAVDAAMASQFQDMMMKAGAIESTMDCFVTSRAAAAGGDIAPVFVFSLSMVTTSMFMLLV